MSVGVIATAHDFRRACQEARTDGELALVPTMGYLHGGHQSLILAAAQRAPTVAVTVVAKLFALSRADCAFFGEKDYQQLLVIRRMNADLNLGVEVIGRPILRESDGLALSSRNAYLSPEERARATALWKALKAVRNAFKGGEVQPAPLEELARQTLLADGLRVDYAEVRDPVELQRPEKVDAASRLFLAAFAGKTRLIDNGAIGAAAAGSLTPTQFGFC